MSLWGPSPVHSEKAKYCAARRHQLLDELPPEQMQLLKQSMQAAFELSPLLMPALLAVREELEL
ncbi:MAG: hypothetical protein L6Q38_16405, partial [Nitrospira sp.]|nr:hypothetical protein [Nitrospira sp.]